MRASAREMTPPHANAAAFFLAGTDTVRANRQCIACGARRLPIVTQ
jgi:hypothetical protein